MNPDLVFGLDPGKKGAIALIDFGRGEWVDDLPIHAGTGLIDPVELDDMVSKVLYRLRPTGGARVGFLMEHPTPVAVNGVNNIFAQGEGWGILVSLAARFSPYWDDWADSVKTIYPNQWKPAVGVTTDKATSLALARTRWPHLANRLARKKDDGRAEALLIAAYGYDNWEHL